MAHHPAAGRKAGALASQQVGPAAVGRGRDADLALRDFRFHSLRGAGHRECRGDVLHHTVLCGHLERLGAPGRNFEPSAPAQQADAAALVVIVHGNRRIGIEHRAAAIGQGERDHVVAAAVIGTQAQPGFG